MPAPDFTPDPLWRGLNTVKIQRIGLLASVALVGSLALTACGSDNNTGSDTYSR